MNRNNKETKIQKQKGKETMYGKMTNAQDTIGRRIYEFDRVENERGEKASVIFKRYPDDPDTEPWIVRDDGACYKLDAFGPCKVLLNEESDIEFCKKYDYRGNK